MNEENMNISNSKEGGDDGTLSFLNLPKKEGHKQFHCDQITLDELVNKTFWVVDYETQVTTRFGDGRYIVQIKFDLDDDESKAKKFFTRCDEIMYVLDQIKERQAFPRKVTLRKHKKNYWFE